MANESKDGWDKVAIITAVIGSLLLPIIIFLASYWFTEQQRQADEARLNEQKKADAAQTNADRISALLTHLASNNPKERLLAWRFANYLVQNGLFPEELSLQDLSLDALDDDDAAVTHAASHVLTEAVTLKPELKKSIETAAETDLKTREKLSRAAAKSPDLAKAIRIRPP